MTSVSHEDTAMDALSKEITDLRMEIARDSQPQSTGRDRRMSPRYAFPAIQAVAPYDGVTLPGRETFRAVRCHDISQRGISFFWPTAPTFRYAVVRLNPQSQPLYLMARVARHVPIAGLNNEFLVCCQFLSRVKAS